MSDTRVLVTVGTHEQPFQRLLDAVSLVIDRGAAAEWVVQYGVATFDPRQALHAEPYLSHDELLRWNQWADIAFTGGSPGGIFDALAADAEPFLIPRRHQHGEHINDHQVEFADRMAELGLVVTLDAGETAEDLANALRATIERVALEDPDERRRRIQAIAAESRARTQAFVEGFAEVVTPLLDKGATRSRRKRS